MRVKADSLEGRKAHAFLDGVDVSSDCVAADDSEGWVDLIVRDENGIMQLDDLRQEPLITRLSGSVKIIL